MRGGVKSKRMSSREMTFAFGWALGLDVFGAVTVAGFFSAGLDAALGAGFAAGLAVALGAGFSAVFAEATAGAPLGDPPVCPVLELCDLSVTAISFSFKECMWALCPHSLWLYVIVEKSDHTCPSFSWLDA